MRMSRAAKGATPHMPHPQPIDDACSLPASGGDRLAAARRTAARGRPAFPAPAKRVPAGSAPAGVGARRPVTRHLRRIMTIVARQVERSWGVEHDGMHALVLQRCCERIWPRGSTQPTLAYTGAPPARLRAAPVVPVPDCLAGARPSDRPWRDQMAPLSLRNSRLAGGQRGARVADPFPRSRSAMACEQTALPATKTSRCP